MDTGMWIALVGVLIEGAVLLVTFVWRSAKQDAALISLARAVEKLDGTMSTLIETQNEHAAKLAVFEDRDKRRVSARSG